MRPDRKVTKQQIIPAYECASCGKHFVRENSYLNHRCPSMKREDEAKSPLGQVAYGYYQTWFLVQKRVKPAFELFQTSKNFVSFMKFAEFSKRIKLPKPEHFIKFMVRKGYQPSMWTFNDVYVSYMEYLDASISPMDLVKESINHLFDLADRKDVDVGEIFDVLTYDELVDMIRGRELSPWVLLNSDKFMTQFESLPHDHRIMIEALMRPDHWIPLIKQQPELTKVIRNMTKEMDL